MYKSKIEEYYFSDQHGEFKKELEKFIGYVTRRFFPGFRQSLELYRNLRADIVAAVYWFIRSGHHDKVKKKIKEEKNRELDFRSYLFTQIRGELTKFFNKFNKKRKIEVCGLIFEQPYEQQYNLDEISLEYIIERDNMKLDDKLEDIIFFLKSGYKGNFKNIYQVKTLMWILYEETCRR